jgi:hypothetical protein
VAEEFSDIFIKVQGLLDRLHSDDSKVRVDVTDPAQDPLPGYYDAGFIMLTSLIKR